MAYMAYMKSMNTINLEDLRKELDELTAGLSEFGNMQDKLEKDLLEHKISNVKRLEQAQIEAANRVEQKRLKNEHEVNEKLIAMGYSTAEVINKATLSERLKAIDEAEQKALKGAIGSDRERIKAEYAEKRKQAEKFDKDRQKLEDKQRKDNAKKLGKELQSAVKSA